MKAPIRVLTGLALCAFSLACSSSGRVAQAKSGNPLQGRTVRAVASTLGAPVHPDWRLGSPFTHNNLTVFPVLADESTVAADLITLDQGLRSGKVIITELGADGRSRIINRRRVSDSAEVNRLSLTNKSGKPLVLIAGEMILGGKQDRIVGHDCIIESSNIPVPLDVFCVEHGRWSGGASFGEGVATGHGTGVGPGFGTGPQPAMGAPMALPNIREKAQASKNQSEVWTAVAETVTVTATATRTGTLTSVYQDKRVNTKVNGFERAFRARLSGGNVVGVVVAVGDVIVSADVFANHSLFRAYWPKMLKSYALEAVSTTKSNAQLVSRNDAESFLARVQGSAAESHEAAYRLAENQSSDQASFELEYTRKTPTLIHFNRVAKK
jgi:ARG and Rhodanese-Phosphatase-superfamily-associated Protein domain